MRPRLVPALTRGARERRVHDPLHEISAHEPPGRPVLREPLAAVHEELPEASRVAAGGHLTAGHAHAAVDDAVGADVAREKIGDAQRTGEVLLRPLRGLHARGRPEHLRKHVQDLGRDVRVELLADASLAQTGGLTQDMPRRDPRPLVAPAELGMRLERIRVDDAVRDGRLGLGKAQGRRGDPVLAQGRVEVEHALMLRGADEQRRRRAADPIQVMQRVLVAPLAVRLVHDHAILHHQQAVPLVELARVPLRRHGELRRAQAVHPGVLHQPLAGPGAELGRPEAEHRRAVPPEKRAARARQREAQREERVMAVLAPQALCRAFGRREGTG